MRILLVDDSRTMRSIEKNVLAALGKVEFVEAVDGIEALMAIATATAPFDLMLIDWNMPNLTGGQLVLRIRETDKTTPLVMVTTEAEKSRVVEALKAGVNGYVIKPFKPEALLDRARQAMGERDKIASATKAGV
jgi:two-component system, chemotaxis family, chemotaxis protein CheY